MRPASQQDALHALGKFAKAHCPCDKAVEVGVYGGEATIIFADYFQQVIAVDPWIDGYDDADCASNSCSLELVYQSYLARIKDKPNITTIRQKSLDALALVPDKSIDFVYIDGNHQHEMALQDIQGWLPKVKAGGIMSGHDYNMQTVNDAVSKVFPGKEAFLFAHPNWAIPV